MERTEIEWLWNPFVVIGKVSLLRGDPGQGKTTFALAMAAMISKGAVPPNGGCALEKGKVLYISAEDNLGDTIKPRLESMEAEMAMIDSICEIGGTGFTFTDPWLEIYIYIYTAVTAKASYYGPFASICW